MYGILFVHNHIHKGGDWMQPKNILALLLMTIFMMSFSSCQLINDWLGLGGGSDDYFYGMVEVTNDTEKKLYLISLPERKIVDVQGGLVADTIEDPHGLAWNNHNNGTFWLADPNENKIHKYTSSGVKDREYVMAADPVNLLFTDDRGFVADRSEDNIFGFSLDDQGDIIQKSDGSIPNPGDIIEIDLDEFLDRSTSVGFIDMAYDAGNSNLYVVSDEYEGFMVVDLSDQAIQEYEDQPKDSFSPLTPTSHAEYAKTEGDFGGLGVAFHDGVVYVNTGNRILSYAEGNWQTLAENLREDSGYTYNGYYVDLVISDKDYITEDSSESKSMTVDTYLYVASGIAPGIDVPDDVPHHIIGYHNDGSGDWEHLGIREILD
jgi:hypothetical protein